MGNVTVKINRRKVVGNAKRVYGTIKLSNSYATSGDTVQAADIQQLLEQRAGAEDLTRIDLFVAEIGSDGTEYQLDRANKKIVAWNGRTQVVNTTDLSGVTVNFMAEYGDDPSPNV